MRSDIIRIYKSVHTWTGIVSGLALFIAFYAGALTMFKEPLARWASPPLTTEKSVPLTEAHALITRTLQQRPDAAEEFWFHLQHDELHRSQLEWQVAKAGADDHDTLSMQHFAAAPDDQGNAVVSAQQPSRLGEFIDVLHRVVGLPVDSDSNRWIMGVVATLYALALVSGVIILLPTLVQDFFALRPGRNRKRMWLDAHNVIGIVSLPFHIVMAMSAVVFAYHDGIYLLQNRLIHEQRDPFGRAAAAPDVAPRDVSAMVGPDELVARAQALSSTFEPTMLQYLRVDGPRAMVRVWGNDASALAPRFFGGFALLDPYSGEVINTDYLPGKQAAAFTTVSSFFALHFATFGGTPVQWIYFFLGMAGAWLFYSGNLLWIESRRKAQRRGAELPAQRRDTYLMAAGTIGVSFGCICGISIMIATAKFLHGRVADPLEWQRYLYYAVFFASIAWAFLRGSARAAVELAWVAAIATLSIPLTSLIAAIFPATGWWVHLHPATLAVDLTALAGGLGFIWMARATARRTVGGARDSVWSRAATQPDRLVKSSAAVL